MKRRIVIRPEADRDLDEIANYLDWQREGLGDRFYEAARRTFEDVARLPTLGAPWKVPRPDLAEMRCATVPRFRKYLVVYLPSRGRIDILRIVHGARNLDLLLDMEIEPEAE